MANWSCCELHSVQSELCQVLNILHLSIHWRSYQLVGDVHHRLNCEGKLSVGFQRMAHLTMSEAFRFVMQSVNCTMFKVHIYIRIKSEIDSHSTMRVIRLLTDGGILLLAMHR